MNSLENAASEDAIIEVLASGVISVGTDMTAPMEAEADVFVLIRKVLAGFSRERRTRSLQSCS